MIGAGSGAIRITTDIFSTWRAAGITCEHDLVTSLLPPIDVLLRLGCDPLSLPESGKTLNPALSDGTPVWWYPRRCLHSELDQADWDPNGV